MVDAQHVPGAGRAEPGLAYQREMRWWLALSIAALGTAGAFALLLAMSRVPGIESLFPWPLGFFHKGLVIHVVFSFIVFFLAVFATLMLVATRDLAGPAMPAAFLGSVGRYGTLAAFPLLFVPAFLDRGEATLNNYIPTIIDPLYYAGLAILAAAVAASAARLPVAWLRRRPGQPTDPIARQAVCALATFLLALAAFALAYRLMAERTPSFAFNEELFWGGGHILQAVNTAMLLIAWRLLAVESGFSATRLGWAWTAAAVLLLLAGTAGVLIYGIFPSAADRFDPFTALQYALGPPAVLAAAALFAGRPRPLPWRNPAFLGLSLSVIVFGAGGVLGFFVDGADTRTPGHYHGVIAGVTLAFMATFYTVLLPAAGRAPLAGRAARVQLHIFAWGQLAAAIGLFVAGGHGVPRKVAGEAQGLHDMMAMAGMGLNGLGGLVAVIGGVMFVVMIARSLLGGTPEARGRTGQPMAGLAIGRHAQDNR